MSSKPALSADKAHWIKYAEELQAQVDLLEMTKDAWRCNEDQTTNQCIWDVQAILDGYTPQALQEKDDG